jgi:hypothetical protein
MYSGSLLKILAKSRRENAVKKSSGADDIRSMKVKVVVSPPHNKGVTKRGRCWNAYLTGI